MFKKLNTKLKGYRTVVFGGALIALPVAAEVFNYLDAAPLEAVVPLWITIPIGAIAIALRYATTGPVGTK